jgi:hypothetical protein
MKRDQLHSKLMQPKLDAANLKEQEEKKNTELTASLGSLLDTLPDFSMSTAPIAMGPQSRKQRCVCNISNLLTDFPD